MDTEELASVPLTFLDEWGPLVTLNGENLPLAPLLRTRGLSNSGILKALLDRLPAQCTSMGLFLFWWEEIFHVVNPNG